MGVGVVVQGDHDLDGNRRQERQVARNRPAAAIASEIISNRIERGNFHSGDRLYDGAGGLHPCPVARRPRRAIQRQIRSEPLIRREGRVPAESVGAAGEQEKENSLNI